MIKIVHSTDRKQVDIVKVSLSNSKSYVTMYENDFNELMDLGLTPRWRLAEDGTPIVSVLAGKAIAVARVLLDARKEKVRYLNGKKTDLRRDNLILDARGGNGKIRARDLLTSGLSSEGLKKLDVKHVYRIDKPSIQRAV